MMRSARAWTSSDSRRPASVFSWVSTRAISSALARPSAASWSSSRRRRSRSRASRPPRTRAAVAATAPTASQRVRDRRVADTARSARASARTRPRSAEGGAAAYASASVSSARSSSARSSTPMVWSSGMSFLLREACAQLEDAVADACLDGTERHLLAGGDLAVRQLLEIRDLDGAPLLLGERRERLADLRGALGARDRVVGTFGRGRDVARIRAAFLRSIARAARAEVVDDQVAHEAQEPRARTAAPRSEALRTAPDAEERLVHRVLAQVGIARDAQRQPVGERREPIVELAERAIVSPRHAGEERRLDVCHVGQRRLLGQQARVDADLPGEQDADRDAANPRGSSQREVDAGEARTREGERH